MLFLQLGSSRRWCLANSCSSESVLVSFGRLFISWRGIPSSVASAAPCSDPQSVVSSTTWPGLTSSNGVLVGSDPVGLSTDLQERQKRIHRISSDNYFLSQGLELNSVCPECIRCRHQILDSWIIWLGLYSWYHRFYIMKILFKSCLNPSLLLHVPWLWRSWRKQIIKFLQKCFDSDWKEADLRSHQKYYGFNTLVQ